MSSARYTLAILCRDPVIRPYPQRANRVPQDPIWTQ